MTIDRIVLLVIVCILLFITYSITYGLTNERRFSFLKEEISVVPPSLELDVIPGKDIIYNLFIKNIGSGDIEFSKLINGIDSSWMDIKLFPIDNKSPDRLSRGKVTNLTFTISKDLSAPSGTYKGEIAILNRLNKEPGHVLERVPLILNVNESNGVNAYENETTPKVIVKPPKMPIPFPSFDNPPNKPFSATVTGTGMEEPFTYQWSQWKLNDKWSTTNSSTYINNSLPGKYFMMVEVNDTKGLKVESDPVKFTVMK